MHLKHNLIVLLFVIISVCGFSLRAQDSNLFQFSDSTRIKYSVQSDQFQDWKNYTEMSLNYKNPSSAFDISQYHPSKVMPKDPFKLDYRTNSYYVPRMVKDELSAIMNRPKDTNFFPILGVAFIAAQLAAKYLILEEKIKITSDDAANSIDSFHILKMLWKQSPLTASQIYKDDNISQRYTYESLQSDINHLINNKLIKQKNIEDKELLYFPAVTKIEFDQLLQRALVDSSLSITEKEKIKNFLRY